MSVPGFVFGWVFINIRFSALNLSSVERMRMAIQMREKWTVQRIVEYGKNSFAALKPTQSKPDRLGAVTMSTELLRSLTRIEES